MPFGELDARIGELLEERPELARNPDATTSVLYSGYTAGSSGAPQAADLVERSGGRIGSLDSTEIGKALGSMVRPSERVAQTSSWSLSMA